MPLIAPALVNRTVVEALPVVDMMDPEETEVEEIGSVPSSYFENSPSPVTGLGGWASGAGNALFAVTKV